MNKMLYDKSKYTKGTQGLTRNKILYVEGGKSKFFYGEIKEFNNVFFVINGGNCGEITKKVQAEENSYGIVDGDYKKNIVPKIFQIDFYSIENIAIHYIQDFKPFVKKLHDLFERTDISKCQYNIINFLLKKDEITKRPKEFDICLLDTKHDTQYFKYISTKILKFEDFLRYKDLKKPVEQYEKFHKQMLGKSKIKYITDLINHIPENPIEHIFEENTQIKIKEIIAQSS